jgi:3-dehydroquinate dehydratase/shikimate dehydrogenase
MAELRAARDGATAGDMVELRLDGVRDLDVAGSLAGRARPVIVTCRPSWEGGHFEGSEEERHRLLRQALELGADYVDIEWGAGFDDLLALDRHRIVLSSHDFGGVPVDLADRARAMRATGAAVIKLAITAARLSDTLPLIDVARGGDAVVIGMGEAGIPSRLLPERYGSRWSYAGNAVAPGQIGARRMIDEFRFRDVRASTRIFGVISVNAMHSASPAMHNAAFAAAGIDAVYLPLRAVDFDDFLTYADGLGIEGASVTIPFKLDALQAARGSDDLTRAIGAANTLRRRGADWDATNTDVAGFLDPLEQAFPAPLRGARAAVLGAGGSARAVVVALLSRGMTVAVHARREEQARDVVGSVGGGVEAQIGAWPPPRGSWDLLVNCTPSGMHPNVDEMPVPVTTLTGRYVYDLIYNPPATKLLVQAALAGCDTVGGLDMLVAQAAEQFHWWTGIRPSSGVMRAAAEQRLSEFNHQ